MIRGSNLLPNGKNRRVKPSPVIAEGKGQELLPLGLLPVRKVSQEQAELLKKDSWLPDFEIYRRKWKMPSPLPRSESVPISLKIPESSIRQGFTINEYRSGELTGGSFTTGLKSPLTTLLTGAAKIVS